MPTTAGRPRSAALDHALSDAVTMLLERSGYAAMTIEQVAREAGVAKTAIYRRWPSKAEMVFALAVHRETIEPLADAGSLEGDLRTVTGRVVDILAAPAARAAMPGLLADAAGDPDLAARLHSSFIDSERSVIEDLLARAVRRGEIQHPVDPSEIHAQLLGTAFAWFHLMAAPAPDDLVEAITRSLLRALTNRAPRAEPA